MKVKVARELRFPSDGWVTTHLVGPNDTGRVLLEITGRSGSSKWCHGVLTAPASAVVVKFFTHPTFGVDFHQIGLEEKKEYEFALSEISKATCQYISSVAYRSDIRLVGNGFEVKEEKDKRGKSLIKLFPEHVEGDQYLIAVNGIIVPEASDEVKILIAAEGRSRTGSNGDRFTLCIANPGGHLTVKPYGFRQALYRVSGQGVLEKMGDSEVVTHPQNW